VASTGDFELVPSSREGWPEHKSDLRRPQREAQLERSPLCNGAPFFDNYAKLDAAVWVLYYSDPVYFHSFASLDAVELMGIQHHWHTLESRSAVFDLGKQISPSFIRRVPSTLAACAYTLRAAGSAGPSSDRPRVALLLLKLRHHIRELLNLTCELQNQRSELGLGVHLPDSGVRPPYLRHPPRRVWRRV